MRNPSVVEKPWSWTNGVTAMPAASNGPSIVDAARARACRSRARPALGTGVEDIAEPGADLGQRRRRRHRPAAACRISRLTERRSSMPWRWSAWAWVNSTASMPSHLGVQQLLRAGRARCRSAGSCAAAPRPAPSTRRRRFFGFGRIAGAPIAADPRHAPGRAAARAWSRACPPRRLAPWRRGGRNSRP